MGKRCANFLVCVATDEDMRTFLLHAADIIAKRCDSAVDPDLLAGAGSVEELYRALYPSLVEHAAALFDASPAEPAGTSDGYRFFGGEYIDEIAPGNTAATGLFSVDEGDYYVFRLCFETAQELSHESVDAFFETLGSGLYGVSLLEASTRNHFKSINFFCVKHEGAAPLFSLEKPYINEKYTCEDLDYLMNMTYGVEGWAEENLEVDPEFEEDFDYDSMLEEVQEEASPFDSNWPDYLMSQCDVIAASVAAVRWPYYRDGLFWTKNKKGSASELKDFDLPEYVESQYNEAVVDVLRE